MEIDLTEPEIQKKLLHVPLKTLPLNTSAPIIRASLLNGLHKDTVDPEFTPDDCRLSTPLKTSTVDNTPNTGSVTINAASSLNSTAKIEPTRKPGRMYGSKQPVEIEDKSKRVSKRRCTDVDKPVVTIPSSVILPRTRSRRSCQKKKDPNFVYFAPSGEVIVSPAKVARKEHPPKRKVTRSSKRIAPSTQPLAVQEPKPELKLKVEIPSVILAPQVRVKKTFKEDDPPKQLVLSATLTPIQPQPISNEATAAADSELCCDEDANYSAAETDYSLPSLVSEPGESKKKIYSKRAKYVDPDCILKEEAAVKGNDTLVSEGGSELSQPFSDYSLPSIGVDDEIEEVGWSQIERVPNSVLVMIFKYFDTRARYRIINRYL